MIVGENKIDIGILIIKRAGLEAVFVGIADFGGGIEDLKNAAGSIVD